MTATAPTEPSHRTRPFAITLATGSSLENKTGAWHAVDRKSVV